MLNIYVPNVEIVLSEGEPLGDGELPESGVVRAGVSELDAALVPVGPLEAVVVGHLDGALAGGDARLLVLIRAPSEGRERQCSKYGRSSRT